MKLLKLPTKFTYFKSETLSSSEMFHKIVHYINAIGRLIGCHFFSEDFTYTNPMLIILLVDLITYLLISFQNIYFFRDDFVRVVFCTVTLGMGFKGAKKLYTFIFKRNSMLKLNALAESFHKSATGEKAIFGFEKWMLVSCHVGIFCAIIFYSCGFFMFIYPVIYYLLTGNKILHFGFIIPGMGWETYHGYALNFAHQVFQIYIVMNALMLCSFSSLFFIINAFSQYASLEALLDNLSDLKDDENKTRIRNCISSITDQHVKLNE